MCPACITTVAWIAAGAASTGGLAVLAVSRLGGKNGNKESDEHSHDHTLEGEHDHDGAQDRNA